MLKNSNSQSISPPVCSGALSSPPNSCLRSLSISLVPLKRRIYIPLSFVCFLKSLSTIYMPILDLQNQNGNKLQQKITYSNQNGSKLQLKITYSVALSQCCCQQAQNPPSLSLSQTGKPPTSKSPFALLLFSSRFPSFPWNLVLFPPVMVELFSASQGSAGCLSLELLTARLDKAHENRLRGTMLRMISQHS